MKKSQGKAPTSVKGERNYKCPHYEECLTKAADEKWKYFSCPSFCKYNCKYEEPKMLIYK